MNKRLKFVAAPEQTLSPEQRRFNELLRKIEKARAELRLWNEARPLFARDHIQRVRPLFDQIYEQQLRVLRLLDGHLASKGWSRRQRRTLRDLTCGLASQLIDNERSDDARVAELKALYDRHAEIDFDTDNREVMAEMRGLFEAFAGIDLGDQEFESEEDLMHHAHEKLRANAEQRAEGAPQAPRKRRPSAAEQRREREEQEAGQSMREIYRKLAGALHPDRASDNDDRIRRTALMQRVNQAYEARDLLALFSLQLEIEQVDVAHIAQATAARARQYNRLLEEQLAQIRAEVVACKNSLCLEFGLDPFHGHQPAKLGKLIDDEVRELRLALLDAERDLVLLETPAGARRWLTQMARQIEHDDDFGDEIPF